MSSPQHEPTMEEILASIRKIISEDAPADAPVAQEGAPAPYHAQPDVLELTQEVMEAPVYQPAPVQPMPQQPSSLFVHDVHRHSLQLLPLYRLHVQSSARSRGLPVPACPYAVKR